MFVCPVSLDPSKHQHHMLMGLPHDRLDQDVQKKRALKIGRGRGGGGMRSIREVTKANSVISALWYPGVTLPDRVPCLVLGRKTVACSSRQYTAPFASPMDVPACSWTPASIMGCCFPPAAESYFPPRGDTRCVPPVCECNVAFLTRGKRTGVLRYALTGGVRTPSSL